MACWIEEEFEKCAKCAKCDFKDKCTIYDFLSDLFMKRAIAEAFEEVDSNGD